MRWPLKAEAKPIEPRSTKPWPIEPRSTKPWPIEPRREVKNRVIELGTAREILAEIYGALSRELI